MSVRLFTGTGQLRTTHIIQGADTKLIEYWNQIGSLTDFNLSFGVRTGTDFAGYTATFGSGIFPHGQIQPMSYTTVVSATAPTTIYRIDQLGSFTYLDTTPPPQFSITASFGGGDVSYGTPYLGLVNGFDFNVNISLPASGTFPHGPFINGKPPNTSYRISPGRIDATSQPRISYLVYPRTDVEVDELTEPLGSPTITYGGSTVEPIKVTSARSFRSPKRPVSGFLYPRGGKYQRSRVLNS
jgi:hypothetical protein